MQKQRVADQVAERIERLIVDGVLKVGQALPSERRLVAKLGCSRSALREGLRALRGRCAGAASSTPSMAVGRSSPTSTATPTPAR